MIKYDAVIVASGKAIRSDLGYNKSFYRMKNGKTVLDCSIETFNNDEDCKQIIVVTNKENFDLVKQNQNITIVEGGAQRKDSVKNGIEKVTSEYVLIHDAARPFLNSESLNELKKKLEDCDGVILAKKSIDTIKVVNKDKIEKTLDRKTIYAAETPQGFKTELIKKCFNECKDINYTDEASMVESLGYDVYVVESKYNNKKLTTKEDFVDL